MRSVVGTPDPTFIYQQSNDLRLLIRFERLHKSFDFALGCGIDLFVFQLALDFLCGFRRVVRTQL